MTTTPPEPEQPFGAGQPPYPGPQQPPTGAPYGAYPTGPAAGAPRQAPPAPEQPASIALAVKLMLVGAGLTVVGLLVSLFSLGDLKDTSREQILRSDPDATQSMIDATYTIVVISAIVGPLISVGLWAWMAWKNGQGRGWARTVATVFGALNVISAIYVIASQPTELVSVLITVVTLALAVVILVLLYKKESTAFYDGVAASRRLY